MLRESIEVARAIGAENRVSTALSNLGVLEIEAGNNEQAIELLERAQQLDEKLGNAWGTRSPSPTWPWPWCAPAGLMTPTTRCGPAPPSSSRWATSS